MKCPKCGSDEAYIGLTAIDCINPNCEHFKETSSEEETAIMSPNWYPNQNLRVDIKNTFPKNNSILIEFKAYGDSINSNRVVEFYWWNQQPRNGKIIKLPMTLSNRFSNYITGVRADGITIYKTHWLCVSDGVKPNAPNIGLEAIIT